jgi:hypothetical protein
MTAVNKVLFTARYDLRFTVVLASLIIQADLKPADYHAKQKRSELAKMLTAYEEETQFVFK